MNTTPRPKKHDNEIVRAAAEKLAPKVKQWIVEVDKNDKTTLEDIVADLASALKYRTDGYEIARALDGRYEPDAQLVEILDDAVFCFHAAMKEACEKWVKENNLQPPALESKVRWNSQPAHGDGIVTANHTDGTSTVMFPELGHVREGMGMGKHKHGYIVAWEELTLL